MSITWMTRVWHSAEPSHPTDRLMLLALADNANEEGYCWPCVKTLQHRCRLQTIRGARKVLERLEKGTFVERHARPGRSNVYRLLQGRLGGSDLQDRGKPVEGSVPRDRGEAERQDREGGTADPGREEPRDRKPRSRGTARTNIEPSLEPSNNNNSGEGVVVGFQSDLVDLLSERGVHKPVAEKLVEQYGAGRVREQIKHYDYLRSQDESPRRPGWLVRAIEQGFSVPSQGSSALKLYSYQEMLAWCEARGDLSLTRMFDPIQQEDKTLFVLKDRRGL